MSIFLPTRRRVLEAGLSIPASLVLTRLGVPASALADPVVAPLETTPACDDDVTPPVAAGPFYKPSSPSRMSLLDVDTVGTRIVLTGHVLSTGCRPVARALLDFWHADDAGEYDNVGQRLRGHQFSDAQGRYRLESIFPGAYAGRTRHIHVKVQAPDGPTLTTQLFFPGEQRNDRDFLFRPQLLVTIADARDGKSAGFDFVLAPS